MTHPITLETYKGTGIRESGGQMLLATRYDDQSIEQAETFAAELMRRLNAYNRLIEAIRKAYDLLNNHCSVSETYAEEMNLVCADLKEALGINS